MPLSTEVEHLWGKKTPLSEVEHLWGKKKNCEAQFRDLYKTRGESQQDTTTNTEDENSKKILQAVRL
jgi:hypothetical protein